MSFPRAAALTLAICLTASFAAAQPKPGDFYEEGYTEGIFGNDAVRAGVTPSPVPEGEATDSESGRGSPREPTTPAEEARGIPVRALSAVLRAEPREHLVNSLKEFADALAAHSRIVRGEVYVVGSPYEYSPEEESAIVRETGVLGVMYDFEPPEFLKGRISRVPTWILETDQGRVLVEAAGPLARFLNSRGEFIEPQAPGSAPFSADRSDQATNRSDQGGTER